MTKPFCIFFFFYFQNGIKFRLILPLPYFFERFITSLSVIRIVHNFFVVLKKNFLLTSTFRVYSRFVGRTVPPKNSVSQLES